MFIVDSLFGNDLQQSGVPIQKIVASKRPKV